MSRVPDAQKKVISRRDFVAGSFAGLMASGVAGAVASGVATPRDAAAASMPARSAAERSRLDLADRVHAGRRFVQLTPEFNAGTAPLVVLLHGLGETGDPRAGAYAWWERYGLQTCYSRLFTRPVVATTNLGYFSANALARVNATLEQEPMRPLAFLCPHVTRFQNRTQLTAFAQWLVHEAIPLVKAALGGERAVLLAGCSLGSYVAFETFSQFPDAFSAVAGVQSAIGAYAASAYAEKFQRAWAPDLARERMYLATSSGDPFRAPTLALSTALTARAVRHTLRDGLGPHDQPWLREVGTLEVLLWLDRTANAPTLT